MSNGEEFEKTCENLNGEVIDIDDKDIEVCVIDETKMGITSDGRTIPIDGG